MEVKKEDLELLVGRSLFFLLFIGLFQLISEITLTSTNGNRFLLIDAQYLSNILPTQTKVEINEGHHERTPDHVQDQQ